MSSRGLKLRLEFQFEGGFLRQTRLHCGPHGFAGAMRACLADDDCACRGSRCCQRRLHESDPGSAVVVGGSSPAATWDDSAFPVDAAAGLVEGGRLHAAARDGDLAAVEARPPASTVCGSCSFVLSRPRLQRLLTESPGRVSVNEKDEHGYAPVRSFPSARRSNSRHSQTRVCPGPRKSHMPGSKCIQIFPRTFVDASVHKPTYMRPVVY
jgi:hypothetical protein